MRIVIILSIVQTASIVLLLVRAGQLETGIEEMAHAQTAALNTRTAVSPEATTTLVQPDPLAIEPLLRGIVREELDAAMTTISATQLSPTSAAEPAPAPAAKQEGANDHYRLDIVSGEIDYYVSQGSISDHEMSDLQMKISGLNESGRKLMMQRLLRAMNSGGLQGRL